jgi:hypothetical protein
VKVSPAAYRPVFANGSSGLRLRDRLRMIGALWAYTSGFAADELGDRMSNTQHGLSEEKKRELAARYLSKIVDTGGFPNLRAQLSQKSGSNPDDDSVWSTRALLRGMKSLQQKNTRSSVP